jgi:RNA polymerase sigma-70 factor (ECF subfamily)
LALSKELSDRKTQEFTEHYNTYYPLLLGSIYTRVRDFHAAEDICQEVFIRYYDKFDEVENPRRWLFGTLRNVTLEHYRKNSSQTVDIDEIFEDVNLRFVNGFRDTRLIIEDALNKIYESDRELEKDKVLFDLVSMYNYSYRQASVELGLGYMQTRYRFKRTLERLVEHLNLRGIKSLEDLL